jgi:hypothetical protein
MEIILVRHGKPAPLAVPATISGRDVGLWGRRYNTGAVRALDRVPGSN